MGLHNWSGRPLERPSVGGIRTGVAGREGRSLATRKLEGGRPVADKGIEGAAGVSGELPPLAHREIPDHGQVPALPADTVLDPLVALAVQRIFGLEADGGGKQAPE